MISELEQNKKYNLVVLSNCVAVCDGFKNGEYNIVATIDIDNIDFNHTHETGDEYSKIPMTYNR